MDRGTRGRFDIPGGQVVPDERHVMGKGGKRGQAVLYRRARWLSAEAKTSKSEAETYDPISRTPTP